MAANRTAPSKHDIAGDKSASIQVDTSQLTAVRTPNPIKKTLLFVCRNVFPTLLRFGRPTAHGVSVYSPFYSVRGAL
jgi:hypothetical protein